MTASSLAFDHFYSGMLGLSLLKKLADPDHPTASRLLYGNRREGPDLILAAIERPLVPAAREGNNSISAFSLEVPGDEALNYWRTRLDRLGIRHRASKDFRGRRTVDFTDPEGLGLRLLSDPSENAGRKGETGSENQRPESWAIERIRSVTVTVPVAGPTVDVLTDLLGFRQTGSYASPARGQADILVFENGAGKQTTAEVHVAKRNDLPAAQLGRGSIHHVAFKAENSDELERCSMRIKEARLPHSAITDFDFYRSFSFRDRNGLFFEIVSTDSNNVRG